VRVWPCSGRGRLVRHGGPSRRRFILGCRRLWYFGGKARFFGESGRVFDSLEASTSPRLAYQMFCFHRSGFDLFDRDKDCLLFCKHVLQLGMTIPVSFRARILAPREPRPTSPKKSEAMTGTRGDRYTMTPDFAQFGEDTDRWSAFDSACWSFAPRRSNRDLATTALPWPTNGWGTCAHSGAEEVSKKRRDLLSSRTRAGTG